MRVSGTQTTPVPHVYALFHATFRLEAATSRLEDLAASPGSIPANMGSLVSTSTAAPGASPPPPPPAPPLPPPSSTHAAVAAEIPANVVAFDEVIINGQLKPFIEMTKGFASASVIEQVSVFCLIFASGSC